MASRNISIPVDAQTERAWGAMGADERRKIEAILGVWLRELSRGESESVKTVMDEAGREVRAKGLTSETLESILRSE